MGPEEMEDLSDLDELEKTSDPRIRRLGNGGGYIYFDETGGISPTFSSIAMCHLDIEEWADHLNNGRIWHCD